MPALLVVPLGEAAVSPDARLELAARMFDGRQISLGLAARMAGLTYSDMVDALGQRGIATLHLSAADLEQQLAAFGP